ncbi:tRNA pseudouridine(55) synthase TruB [Paenibacillus radicis (ex Xue et al. 2023)]|uniref:tRNA pseudouridine synthase B n=1 Tax=Paenibacillus radicis (ex Xue et al. 2023) TaxID=2972489 RepID=A0ABT1YFN2_9BACL|nr:tRNA pseudouridine(55) synthase TruB [Paenibacillus radicis (ex Xue et al. 2023)]MCR8630765.1 tRNA pseudouridine(55) synthase TruB [Paenibacillus radicis (ex Xue et al. 2023)]
MTKETFEGILPVWKPKGFTSHDVVAKVRGILRIKRIGHTGTLDPQVTGVLPLCIGRATRLVEYIQELPKAYEATLKIGIATDTEDAGGEIIERADEVRLSQAQVEEVISSFVGEIEQVPPMYSAVKVDGKRLYELARQGLEVERKSRKVTIYKIDILQMDLDLPCPEIRFHVQCSKGTYIRTLCVDMGKKLGYPAVMSDLVRTSTGSIGPEQCLTLEQIQQEMLQGTLAEKLIPAQRALAHLPSVNLTDEQARRALLGQKVVFTPSDEQLQAIHDRMLTAYSPNAQFVGIFQWDSGSSELRPVKVFS